MAKLTIKDVNLSGQRVLVRVDYNVPMEEREGRMVVTDATRIQETLPTLKHLLQQGARLILTAHLGRPKGKREPAMSLAPVAVKLQELLGQPVRFVDDCIGPKVEQAARDLKDGEALLLENVRYYAQEEANDAAFAEQLAGAAQAYVNDAFGSAHRAHASTEGVARIIARRGGVCVAGLLMEKELRFLGEELEQPARPFVVILGGAKVSDKITVIDRLIEQADSILIGGAMAYTFRLAQGARTGRSLVEPDKAEVARAALAKAKARNMQFLLPSDDIVAVPVTTDRVDKKGKPAIDYQNVRTNTQVHCPDDAAGLDIGPATVQAYANVVAGAKTILWNGPMGLFEDKRFAEGTNAIARAVATATQRGAKSIIGGGDSVKALNKAKLGDQVTFMSTGGGASLEFLEGQVLPGVAALADAPAPGRQAP
ncbi:MAG: phosphoglycerate kinase [Verrucomicrobia bacterium]|nr:phosphoglycerate kinase [Verrucomicrobiota bacterium]